MMRIYTYNVFFGKRLPNILAWMAAAPRAAIYCFQEFPESGIDDCLNVLGHTSYGFSFAPSMKQKKAVYGELTLYRSDVRLKSVSTLVLRTNRLDRISIGRMSGRICLVTVFVRRGVKFAVANTHLSALATNRARYTQIKDIIDFLKPHATAHLILGDFNVTSLVGRKKFFAFMRKHLYRTHEKRVITHKIALLKHQVDYVFGKKCEIVSVEALRIRFSDHYPVAATILFKK